MAYKKNLYKEFKDIKHLDDVIETYVDYNIRAINGITDKIAEKLTKRIVNGVKQGKTNEEIANSIRYSGLVDKSIYKTLKTRTKLMADHQITLLNADLTKLRYKFNRLDRYVWRTRQDGRVRPEHADREGEVFYWNKPPAGGNPGEDWGCRCWAEPYIEDETEEL